MLIAIYLNDHLAGATGVRELARRSASSNRGSRYGPFLEQLAREIDEDRNSLLEIMRALDVGSDPLKLLGGWWVEKLGRLKLNGHLLGYSPLSRVVELEAIELGVNGKLCLWRTLEMLAPSDRSEIGRRLSDFDFKRLIGRAERQLGRLEKQRLAASREAFKSGRRPRQKPAR